MDIDQVEKLVEALIGNDTHHYLHKQVDSGFGYTCDRGVKGFLVAFNRNRGVLSICSCESSADRHWLWIEFYATPLAMYQLAKAFESRTDIVSDLETWPGHHQYGKHSVHASLEVRPDCGDAAIALLSHLEDYPVSAAFAFLPNFLQVAILRGFVKHGDPFAGE